MNKLDKIFEECKKDGRMKVVRCECGKVFMACLMPWAEIDTDEIKEFAKYARQGYKIEYVTGKFEWCIQKECEKKPESQLNIFQP